MFRLRQSYQDSVWVCLWCVILTSCVAAIHPTGPVPGSRPPIPDPRSPIPRPEPRGPSGSVPRVCVRDPSSSSLRGARAVHLVEPFFFFFPPLVISMLAHPGSSGLLRSVCPPTPRQHLVREVVDLLDVSQGRCMVKLEVLQQPVVETKDPAMHDGELLVLIRLLHGGGLDDVAALLDDVELHQAVVASVALDGVELLLMQAVDIADIAQPGVQETQVLWRHGGLDAAAAVMAADDDVLDLEVLDGVVDDGHGVEVDVADEVGDVAVDKGLAGLEAGDLLGGDARVGAADPEVVGALAGAEGGEEARVLGVLVGGPARVVLEDAVVGLLEVLRDFLVVGHGGERLASAAGRWAMRVRV